MSHTMEILGENSGKNVKGSNRGVEKQVWVYAKKFNNGIDILC